MEPKLIKRVEAFDFDDTLARTRSKIGVRLENATVDLRDFLENNGLEVLDDKAGFLWLCSRDYVILEDTPPPPGDEYVFDYHQTMSIDLRTARGIRPLLDRLHAAQSDPETLPIILTARPGLRTEYSPYLQKDVKCKNRAKISQFLRRRGIEIPDENLHTVGDTYGDTAEAKANVLEMYLKNYKLQEVVFYDDGLRNVRAACRLKNLLPPGSRLRVYQATDGKCKLWCDHIG